MRTPIIQFIGRFKLQQKYFVLFESMMFRLIDTNAQKSTPYKIMDGSNEIYMRH